MWDCSNFAKSHRTSSHFYHYWRISVLRRNNEVPPSSWAWGTPSLSENLCDSPPSPPAGRSPRCLSGSPPLSGCFNKTVWSIQGNNKVCTVQFLKVALSSEKSCILQNPFVQRGTPVRQPSRAFSWLCLRAPSWNRAVCIAALSFHRAKWEKWAGVHGVPCILSVEVQGIHRVSFLVWLRHTRGCAAPSRQSPPAKAQENRGLR